MLDFDQILDIVEGELKDLAIDLRANAGKLRSDMQRIFDTYSDRLTVEIMTTLNPLADSETKERASFNRDHLLGQMKADVAQVALGQMYQARQMVATVFSTAMRVAIGSLAAV